MIQVAAPHDAKKKVTAPHLLCTNGLHGESAHQIICTVFPLRTKIENSLI
jgi:hypothetical protein